MDVREKLVLTEKQRLGLQELARSANRSEADQARTILATADGETSPEIGRILGIRPDCVRRWRMKFQRGGVDALRLKPKPGRPPTKATVVLPVVKAILAEETPEGVVWTVPRLKEEVVRRTGESISPSWLLVVMKKKGGFAGRGRGTRSRAGKMWLPSSGPGCD